MPDLLIVYGTTEGQTLKIAEFLEQEAPRLGYKAALFGAAQVPDDLDFAPFARVIVAASVHIERHQPAVIEFVRNHRAALQARPSAFVSVSLSAAGDAEERYDAWEYTRRFSSETDWRPDNVQIVAGALRFTEQDFFKRWAMKRLAKDKRRHTRSNEDYEYTDWSELLRFLEDFLRPRTPH